MSIDGKDETEYSPEKYQFSMRYFLGSLYIII